MTFVVPQEEMLHEIEEDTRRSWAAYSESVRGLKGKPYEAAEDEAWQRLQAELVQLARRRRGVLGQPDA